MAAGWLRHLAGDGVEVMSGGSAPAEQVNAAAAASMREVGIDIADEYPKPWTDETLGAADVVVTMGCGDACPVYPGKRYMDWQLDDPAGKPVEQVRPSATTSSGGYEDCSTSSGCPRRRRQWGASRQHRGDALESVRPWRA